MMPAARGTRPPASIQVESRLAPFRHLKSSFKAHMVTRRLAREAPASELLNGSYRCRSCLVLLYTRVGVDVLDISGVT